MSRAFSGYATTQHDTSSCNMKRVRPPEQAQTLEKVAQLSTTYNKNKDEIRISRKGKLYHEVNWSERQWVVQKAIREFAQLTGRQLGNFAH